MSVTIHPRPAPDLKRAEITAWTGIPVSIAVDLAPDCQLDNTLRPLTTGARSLKLVGPALTVSCTPPDFGAVVHALDHIQKGDVLVIAALGDVDTAVIGEILGGHLRARGCAGLVVDGVVRDIDVLGGFDNFPVFARGVNPRGPTSASDGSLNNPVTLKDRTIAPGDLILGDRDGLASLSPQMARDLLKGAQDKVALEQDWIDGLASGMSAKEVFGL